jgi:hypothetical protein
MTTRTTTCGFCGGRGWVRLNAYDSFGRARTEDERQAVCEYCNGSRQCEDGDRLIAAIESPPAGPADLE